MEEGIQDGGESQGGSSVGSSSNPFNNDLHMEKIGDSGTMGGTAADILVVIKGEGL